MSMEMTREDIMEDILSLMKQLAEDWEYAGEITPQTRFFADMNLVSLDIVVLGTAVQEHYGAILPFPEFFLELGQRGTPDIPISEWVDFIHAHINDLPFPQQTSGE
jgi:acyl carrier protein